MKKILVTILFFFVLAPDFTFSLELRGSSGIEVSYYPYDPLSADQKKEYGSIFINPEFYITNDRSLSFTLSPYLRLDSGDKKRNQFDLREAKLLLVRDKWELRLGVDKVFWGVTESQHLVDIINQTDYVESADGEEKLGQPMVYFSFPFTSSTLDLFLLPYFRERTFPGKKGRLKFPLEISDDSLYESSKERYHIDIAVRYSILIDNWDVGISHFHGTSREPFLKLSQKNSFEPIMVPFYNQIDQTGLDVQLVADSLLLKLETTYQSGGKNTYQALTLGCEYTFTGYSKGDVGVLFEWLYDTRKGKNSEPIMENDVMVGIRYSAYDVKSTQFLAGVIQDLNSNTKIISIEAQRRINDYLKIFLEFYSYISVEKSDPLFIFKDDDVVKLKLGYYF